MEVGQTGEIVIMVTVVEVDGNRVKIKEAGTGAEYWIEQDEVKWD